MPTAQALVDNFNDNAIDFGLWPGTFGASETGGQAVVTCTTSYPRYESADGYSLVDSYFFVQVVSLPNIGNNTTQAALQAAIDGDNRVEFVAEAPAGSRILTMRQVTGGSFSDTNVTYDATAHAWWRLRAGGGNVYWDTAPDGSTWTNRRTASTTLDLSDLVILLVSGYYGTEPDPGSTTFDNVNTVPSLPPASPTRRRLPLLAR